MCHEEIDPVQEFAEEVYPETIFDDIEDNFENTYYDDYNSHESSDYGEYNSAF